MIARTRASKQLGVDERSDQVIGTRIERAQHVDSVAARADPEGARPGGICENRPACKARSTSTPVPRFDKRAKMIIGLASNNITYAMFGEVTRVGWVSQQAHPATLTTSVQNTKHYSVPRTPLRCLSAPLRFQPFFSFC